MQAKVQWSTGYRTLPDPGNKIFNMGASKNLLEQRPKMNYGVQNRTKEEFAQPDAAPDRKRRCGANRGKYGGRLVSLNVGQSDRIHRKMTDTESIIGRLQNAQVIVRDNLSYIYLMSEHSSDMRRYNLGNGAFVSAISLLAAMNLLAKIHLILVKGVSSLVGMQQQKDYQRLAEAIKQSKDVRWAEAKKYIRKPRIGEINETDAFLGFIKACPIDFGIDKSDDAEIRKVWNTYRNKLTHIIALAGDLESGQMLMGVNIQPSRPGMYPINLEFIRNRISTYKPFDFPLPETKKAFKGKTDFDQITLQHILKDKCHVERLTIAVDMAINWLIQTLNDDDYPSANCAATKEWLDLEMQPQVQ